MPKVFVLNDGGYDYSTAQTFGEVVICSTGFVKKDISYCYRLLSEKLSLAQASDFIVLSGLTSLCCVATALFIEKFGSVNFLIFKDDRYVPQTLTTMQGNKDE